MRLPYDLHFSPDGAHLAFSTSYHLSACVSPGGYYVSNPDGSNAQTLFSPSLQPSINTDQARFPVGYSYAWMPGSDAIVAHGNVVDCSSTSPNPGQPIAGPQMSILGLDGSERTIIPGYFWGFSVDRTGNYIAAAHHQNGFQDVNPVIEIYSSQTGGLILSLGSGNAPVFQP